MVSVSERRRYFFHQANHPALKDPNLINSATPSLSRGQSEGLTNGADMCYFSFVTITRIERKVCMSEPTTDVSQECTCRKCNHTFVPSLAFDFYPDGSDPKVGLCERCMMKEALTNREPSDDPAKVPDGHQVNICKFGKGPETCSFLGMTGNEFQCLKGSSLESVIRQRRRENSIRAKGDNCSGPPDFKVAE